MQNKSARNSLVKRDSLSKQKVSKQTINSGQRLSTKKSKPPTDDDNGRASQFLMSRPAGTGRDFKNQDQLAHLIDRFAT